MNFKKSATATAAAHTIALLTLNPALPAGAQQSDAPPALSQQKTEDQKAEEGNQAAASKKPSATLDTVIVTSDKRAQAAHKIPYNVSALTESQLREENITDIKKLIAHSEAINAPGNSARFADSVTVRGLNVSAVNANNIEQFVRSTLAYYLDDTMLPNIGYRIKDVARVETLLGPQGTLYGAGSLGGTVRYITNKPRLGKTEAQLNTSFYQTENGGLSNDTDAVFNLPLGENFALRASLARLDEKGYTDRLSNPPWRTGTWTWTTQPDPNKNLYEDDDWQKVNTARVSLLWRLTPDVLLSYSHAEQSQTAHGTSGVSLYPVKIANATTPAQVDAAWRLNISPCLPANCTYTDSSKTPPVVNDHTILSRYPEFADRDFKLDSLDLDWDLGFAVLHSNTSRFSDSRIGQADYTNQGNAFYNWFPSGNVRKSNNSLYMTFDNSYSGISSEARLVSKGDGPLNWITGVFFTKQKRNLRFNEIFPGIDKLPPEGDFTGIDRAAVGGVTDSGYSEDLGSEYKELAAYGELNYAVTDRWRVMAGARVFRYSDKGSALIVDYAGGLADTRTQNEGRDKGQSYYKLNTSYQLSEDFLGYATYSQGFRRGGNNSFRDYPKTNQFVAPDTQNYSPDTTDNYELGLKGFMLDRQLYVQTDVYRIDWKNVQTYYSQGLPDPYGLGIDFPLNGTVNGPDARSTGWEFSARLRLNENWQLSYNTATTRAKWVSTKQRCTYTEGGNRPGSADDPDGPDCRVWSAGGQLNGAPKWKHNFGLRFNTIIGDDYDFSAALGARYVGKIGNDRTDSASETPPLYYPSYTLYDGNVGLYKGDWGLSLWVQNIANTRAQVSVQNLGDTLLGTRMIYTTPRTIGLNFSYTFR
ncbi:TonB-dependent receptor [Roseateles violae]|uniref:TonB-dependent receptor n=1 Tax=Roseateles violae TaxID=3058042 RepID=A0ABT8DQ77_9BURK|nr:TonB-dependent receptor [Pelomonas sp. PFR6]MDN3920317.1 TonB-dependent receptor [Pelomonas sp. PFR6]